MDDIIQKQRDKFIKCKRHSKGQKGNYSSQPRTVNYIGSTKRLQDARLERYPGLKGDYTKEYALPINKNEQLKFQFWGCANPPKKIKVRNPFLTVDQAKDHVLTSQTTNLLKHYLARKVSQERKTVIISPAHKSSKYISPLSLQVSNNQNESRKDFSMQNFMTSPQLSPKKTSTFDTKFFMSTMITDCEDVSTHTPQSKFRPFKQKILMEKMHELKERISQKNDLLGQIKSNMNMIRFKKMNQLKIS